MLLASLLQQSSSNGRKVQKRKMSLQLPQSVSVSLAANLPRSSVNFRNTTQKTLYFIVRGLDEAAHPLFLYSSIGLEESRKS
jgi:hypothetical protein